MPSDGSIAWEKELRGSSRPTQLINGMLKVLDAIESVYASEVQKFATDVDNVSVRKLGQAEAAKFDRSLTTAVSKAKGIIEGTSEPLCDQINDYILGQAKAVRKNGKLPKTRTVRDKYVREARKYIDAETSDIKKVAQETVRDFLASGENIDALRNRLASLLNRSGSHAATVFRSEIQNAYVGLVKQAVLTLKITSVLRVVAETGCELCKALEGEHKVDSKQAFEVPHPNCACTFHPIVSVSEAKMAKSALSHGDIRTLLQAALTAANPGKDTYVWLREVYQDRAIYQVDNGTGRSEMYQCSYTIDKDNKVTLGDKQAVVERKTYEAVAKPALFTGDVIYAEDEEFVTREGKIFEAGDYPDKDFSLTGEELAEAVAEFQPVNVDYEHVAGPLDGKLGQLTEVWAGDDGSTLFGRVKLPKWLDSALGTSQRKVSTTWDRNTKRLKSLALVVNPRVSDAALMAAFAGKRHSDKDLGDFQSIHDLMVTHGAQCSPKQKEFSMPGEVNDKNDETTFLDRLGAAIGRAVLGAQGNGGATIAAMGAQGTTDPPAAAQDELPASFKSQMDALEAELALARSQRILAEAQAWVTNEIAAFRAVPAEAELLIATYREAAADDLLSPREVTFSTVVDGKPAQTKGSRVDALKARQALRPVHKLTKEGLGDGKRVVALFNQEADAAKDDENKPLDVTSEHYRKLMEATPLGRAILEKQAKSA